MVITASSWIELSTVRPGNHPDYPARIVNIDETDFWSSQSPARAHGHRDLRARAAREGGDGRRRIAYALLVEYHAGSLLQEWAAIRAGNVPVTVMDSALPEGGSAAGVISQRWHSPFPFTILAPGRASVMSGGRGMLIAADANPWLRCTETRTVYTAAETSGKLDFPERYQLRLQCWNDAGTAGAIGCVTVLVPFSGKRPRIALLRRRPLADGLAFLAERIEVTVGTHTDVWDLSPDPRPGLSSHPLLHRRR